MKGDLKMEDWIDYGRMEETLRQKMKENGLLREIIEAIEKREGGNLNDY